MIQHEMGAFTGNQPIKGIVEGFDSQSAWGRQSKKQLSASIANKRMLSDWFSAALQTSRKCGR
tara:strand:+ start:1637 stop:1825 length:189 start_codon:yes stop_codon:yes gene_type:complete